jgi:hypothetical protein
MATQSPFSSLRVPANSFHLRTANPRVERTGDSSAQHLSPAFRQARAFLAAIMDRRARAEDAIAARHAGCSWGDSTERKLVEDITNPHQTRW